MKPDFNSLPSGIIGYGQLGQALYQFLKPHYQLLTQDLDHNNLHNKPLASLHICIPYSKSFFKTVTTAIATHQPFLTLIHSTVKPGTTSAIAKSATSNLIHTPFIGLHPKTNQHDFSHSKKSTIPPMHQFFNSSPKIIGPTTKASSQLTRQFFKPLQIKLTFFSSASVTELAKLLDTTYYSWNIIFEKWVHQLCAQTGTNFDQVYTQYNQIYNQIYQPILPSVTRPVLQHHDGSIGGHCLIPNTQILEAFSPNPFTKFVLKQNRHIKKLASNKQSKSRPS